jgi:hypothetical protein
MAAGGEHRIEGRRPGEGEGEGEGEGGDAHGSAAGSVEIVCGHGGLWKPAGCFATRHMRPHTPRD